jgi:hypothetical protein
VIVAPPLKGRHPVQLPLARDGRPVGRIPQAITPRPGQTVTLPAHLGPDAAVAHLIGRLGLSLDVMLPAAVTCLDGGDTYCYAYGRAGRGWRGPGPGRG